MTSNTLKYSDLEFYSQEELSIRDDGLVVIGDNMLLALPKIGIGRLLTMSIAIDKAEFRPIVQYLKEGLISVKNIPISLALMEDYDSDNKRLFSLRQQSLLVQGAVLKITTEFGEEKKIPESNQA